MKNPLKVLGLCVAALCFAFAVPKNGGTKKVTVVIDAAHGGKDFGAAYGSLTEKEIVSQIAAKIREQNKDSEITIHLLRDKDEFISLEDRVSRINGLKPDLVLSLHINYTDKAERSGMEIFVSDKAKKYKKSSEYAKKLADKLEGAKFEVDVKEGPFYLLKRSEVPAVQFEMGYLSDAGDRAYLTDKEDQQAIAGIVLDFIKEMK